MVELSVFDTLSYSIVLKFLNALKIPVSDFDTETVTKIKEVMTRPETKKQVEEILQSYSKISEDILRDATEKVVVVWQETLKKTGQNATRFIADIVPILGPLILGTDAMVGVVAHTAEGVNSLTAIAGKAIDQISSKIDVKPIDLTSTPAKYVAHGGFLLKTQTRKKKFKKYGKQKGGSSRKYPNYENAVKLIQSSGPL